MRGLLTLYSYLMSPVTKSNNLGSRIAAFSKGRQMDDPLIKGGQGRTQEEAEALAMDSCWLIVLFVCLLLVWCAWRVYGS